MSEILLLKKDTKFPKLATFRRRWHTDKETKIKQVKCVMGNLTAKKLTDGKFTVLHVVPVHHCDMRTSPVTPPTGAP